MNMSKSNGNKAENLKLTDEVFGLVMDMVNTDYSEFNKLRKQVQALDPELGKELESTVNFLISENIADGFILGWQASRKPEILIFQQGGNDEQS
jgi:hypothetical protein